MAGARTALGGIRLFHVALAAAWILTIGFFLAQGWSYYNLPLQERPFNEAYNRFKPGGTVGLDLGVWGTVLMAFGVLTYSVRKRVRRFNNVGRLRNWLSFHIFLCTLGAAMVLLHTSFKLGGLIAISLISMLVVVASGITGRFLYVRVPKTINGQMQSLKAVQAERTLLLEEIQSTTGLSHEQMAALFPPSEPLQIKGFFDAAATALKYEFSMRKRRRQLTRNAREAGMEPALEDAFNKLVRHQMRLEKYIVMLTPFQRLFRHWLTLHIPLTIVMAIIVVLHIGVAIAFGYVIEF